MKKSLVIFGLLALALTVLPLTQASRLRYHQWLYQQSQQDVEARNTRNLQRRNAPEGQTAEEKKEAQTPSYVNGRENLRYPRENKRNYYSKQREYYGYHNVRPSSRRTRYSGDRVYSGGHFYPAVWKDTDVTTSYNTFINDYFSLDVPEGWFFLEEAEEAGQEYVFANPDNQYEIRVSVTNGKLCAYDYNFEACGINLSKSENHTVFDGQGSLNIKSTVVRDARWRETVLHEPSIQTQTVSEAFVAQNLGRSEVYYNRYFVDGVDGKIYMVETTVDYADASPYVGVSKRVFDSFRVFGE